MSRAKQSRFPCPERVYVPQLERYVYCERGNRGHPGEHYGERGEGEYRRLVKQAMKGKGKR